MEKGKDTANGTNKSDWQCTNPRCRYRKNRWNWAECIVCGRPKRVAIIDGQQVDSLGEFVGRGTERKDSGA